ncbi:hypothetical protein [Nocardia sp. NPDC057440]|uniref:hypothetical protein n=1 Tax=Nocardia sp. NPDC057440 TaxID=3346134 RepID=UPI003671ACA6
MKFRQLTEINENEGETWHYWLQVNGNEVALGHLEDFLEETANEMDQHHPEFAFEGRIMSEQEVDVLIKHADHGYMPTHQKFTGKIVLPDDLEILGPFDLLYKGAVEDLFE